MSPEEDNVVRPDAFQAPPRKPPPPQRASAAAVRAGRTFAAAEFAGLQVPSREWLVDGLIPASSVTLLSGDGGTGKSLLALQLAFSLSIGRPWLGRRTTHGSSLFITAEDSVEELHLRSLDIAAELNLNLGQVGNVSLLSLAGEEAILAQAQGATLKTTKRFVSLENLVKRLKPALVVMDTLADFFAGDENNRSQARQFISLLRNIALKQHCAVLLLSHPSLVGMMNKSGLSGSTAWNASVRSRLYLERVTDTEGREADPDLRKLRLVKANYASTGSQISMRWRRGVFLLNDDAGASFATLKNEHAAEALFLHLLDAYSLEGRAVGASPAANFAPTVFSRDTKAKGIGKSALIAAMNRLLERHIIRIEEYGPVSKLRKRLVRAEHDGVH